MGAPDLGGIMRRSRVASVLISLVAVGLLIGCADKPASLSGIPGADSPVRTAPTLDPISCRKPEYPVDSLKAGEIGTVRLKFLVNAGGNVTTGVIERSSGYERLDIAALEALKTCTFKPATLDGAPVSAWAPIEFTWRLQVRPGTETQTPGR